MNLENYRRFKIIMIDFNCLSILKDFLSLKGLSLPLSIKIFGKLIDIICKHFLSELCLLQELICLNG